MRSPSEIGATRTSFASPPQGVARSQTPRHEDRMTSDNSRPRRSVLYVPAANERALSKIAALACDSVILDLEDAVAPAEKPAARARLAAFLEARPKSGPEIVVRINSLSGEWGADDLAMAG